MRFAASSSSRNTVIRHAVEKAVIISSQRVTLGACCGAGLGDSDVGTGLRLRPPRKAALQVQPRRALGGLAAGGILTGITVVLSAVNAVSTVQSIALALPAALLTIGGLIRAAAPDAWTAWRRGFRAGCDTVRQLPGRPEGRGDHGENGPRRDRRLCARC